MTKPELPEDRPTLFTRMFGATRYVMAVATLAIFVGATVLLVLGIFDMANAIWSQIFRSRSLEGDSIILRVAVIESVDIILISTVLYVIAFGLYQLFVDHKLRSTLPLWLQISAISNLEERLAGMVIIVLSIIALTSALESHGKASGSGLGFEIAAVIAAISLFLFQEHKGHPPGSGPEE